MCARVVHRLSRHTGSANAAVFDATGDYVVSGGQDRRVLLSSASSGQLVQSYEGHGWPVQGVAVAPGGAQLASCGGDRLVFVWDVGSAQVSRRLPGHEQRVDCVAFGDTGAVVASGSFDKTVCIWDLRAAAARAPLQVLRESRDGVASLAMAGPEIVAGSIDGCVRTYDLRAGRVLEDALGAAVVSAAPADSAGRLLVVGCMDSAVRLLDRKASPGAGDAVATFTGHKCSEYRIRCDANDAVAVSGSEDGAVYVWDVAGAAQPRSRLSGHTGIVNSVVLHPRSNAMVSAASDGSVIVWG
ncbi:hypothetical protein H4R18_004598 [Coemansia javaensis]|uniref:Uncharacterized protein n=1 Tax=Coemansia javaensis TaxID=2761396 RepID=A0A9W8H8K1_9FUNG|nr:hypothetical protein H4R18_004598 [Coemansia javaensis]